MMRILRAHQFLMGISHRYRPKTAGTDGFNRAIRACAMEEIARCHHRFVPIRPESKVLRRLKLVSPFEGEQLACQSLCRKFAMYSLIILAWVGRDY